MLAVVAGPDNVEVLYVSTISSEVPTKSLPVEGRVYRCQEVVMDRTRPTVASTHEAHRNCESSDFKSTLTIRTFPT